MSVFVLSDEAKAALAASTDPVVIGVRDTLIDNYGKGAAAEQVLSQVAEAKAAAQKSLDESDLDEAVQYRGLLKARDEFKAGIDKLIEDYRKQLADKYAAKISEQTEAIKSARQAAMVKLSETAGDDIDITQAAADFTTATALVSSIAALIKDRGIDVSFTKTTVDKVVNGKRGAAVGKGDGSIKRPRWGSLAVNGEQVKTLSEAAKVIGMSAKDAADNFLLKCFMRDNGNLVAGNEYTTTVTYADKSWTLVGSLKESKSSAGTEETQNTADSAESAE